MIYHSKSPFEWLLNSKAWHTVKSWFNKNKGSAPKPPKIHEEGWVKKLILFPFRLAWWLVKALFGCGCVILVLIALIIIAAITNTWPIFLLIIGLSTLVWFIYMPVRHWYRKNNIDQFESRKSQRLFNILFSILLIMFICGTGGIGLLCLIPFALIWAVIQFTQDHNIKKVFEQEKPKE